MNDEDMFNVWKKGESEMISENQIMPDNIISMLKGRISKSTLGILILLYTFFIVQLSNLTLAAINLPGYENNPDMLIVISVLIVVCLAFLSYGIFMKISLNKIEHYEMPLFDMVNRRIKFAKVHFEVFLICLAFSIPILSFLIGILADNQNGFYKIYNPGIFILFTIVQIAFVYLSNRIVSYMFIREMKSYLKDIENETLDYSGEYFNTLKKYKWILYVSIAILTLFLLFGIYLSMG